MGRTAGAMFSRKPRPSASRGVARYRNCRSPLVRPAEGSKKKIDLVLAGVPGQSPRTSGRAQENGRGATHYSCASILNFLSFQCLAKMEPEDKKRSQMARQALMRQTGYNFEVRTEAKRTAMVGELVQGDSRIEIPPNPLMLVRAR